MGQRIKIRRDTAANLASTNPVLQDGELCLDKTNKILKVGDGVSTWSALPSLIANNQLPIGSIHLSVVATNPNTTLGYGTWAAWATGQVPVGIDTGQTEFSTVEKTGGEKTHLLTIAEIPAHTHALNSTGNMSSTVGANIAGTAGATNTRAMVSQPAATGGGAAFNVLQPYITCYMWKRTA